MNSSFYLRTILPAIFEDATSRQLDDLIARLNDVKISTPKQLGCAIEAKSQKLIGALPFARRREVESFLCHLNGKRVEEAFEELLRAPSPKRSESNDTFGCQMCDCSFAFVDDLQVRAKSDMPLIIFNF
jgi:hypothetical protein